MKRYITLLLSAVLLISQAVNAQEFDDLNNLAFKERDAKNYQKAITLCTQSINKKENARAYIIRGDCRYYLNDYEMAIDDFNTALTYYSAYYSDNKEKAGIYYMLGRCKQLLERYVEAIGDFNKAKTYEYKEIAYLYWNRGACYYESGKYKEADEDYVKAMEGISDKADLSALSSDRGDCKAKLKDTEAAYALYTKSILYNPKNYIAYWQRGHYKGQNAKYEEALADFNMAIEIIQEDPGLAKNNDLAILYRNKAVEHKSLKQYTEALQAINKSAETDPNMAKTYRVRGDIYKAMKSYDKAKADYGNAIILQPDKKIKADIYLDRAILERDLLDFKSCLDDLNKAIEQDPKGVFYWHRSILYGYKKNYPAAITECNTAMDLYRADSSSIASLLWLRATHKDNAGDYEGAAEDYKAYLKYYPASYSGYYELGRLFKWRLKNNDLAGANLSKATMLVEKAADTSKLAYITLVGGDVEMAISKMRVHIDRYKNDKYQYKWELHSMACIYALAKNTTGAFEYVEKSMKAGFDDYVHLVNDRDLVTLMKLPQWKALLTKYKVPVIKN